VPKIIKINLNLLKLFKKKCRLFFWTRCICLFGWNRQKSLEDNLLAVGQFKDALQLLLDWLYKVEPSLNEDQPLRGDIDTVNSLIEQHKVFVIVDSGGGLASW